MTTIKDHTHIDARESNSTDPQTTERLLSERDVALRQGRAIKTLQNQRVSGDGIPFLKLGRIVRYRMSDVLAWEQAHVRTSTSDKGGDR